VGAITKISSLHLVPAKSGFPARETDPRRSIFTRSFTVLLVVQVAFGFCISAFFILPKFLTLELRATAEQIGLITATAGFLPLITVPFIGSWIDRYGRKPFIVIGAGISALASLLFIFVDIYGPLLFGLRILQTVAFNFAFNASATLVVDEAPKERLGKALGLFGVSSLVTNGLAPYLLEPIADRYGWKPVFLFAAAAGLLAFALSCAIRTPVGAANERPSGNGAYPDQFFRLMAATLISSFAIGSAFGAMFSFYQPYALELGINRVRGFFIGFSFAAVGSRLGFSDLADRMDRRRVSVGAMLIYGLAVIAMAWLRPGTLEWLGAAFGLAHGIIFPALCALAIESAGEEARGHAITYYGGAFSAGNTLSAWSLGWLATRVGFPPVFVLAGLLVIGAAGILSFKKA
jgi:MFS family permease